MADQTAPPKNDDSTVRILTLNAFLRPPGIKTNASDYKEHRVDFIIRHILPNYDIVSFQELFAFMSERRRRLIRAAEALGFKYWYGSSTKSWLDLSIDGGLLTLSRYPIVATDSVQFPRGKFSDWLCAKGAIYAKIQLPASGTHLHLFTTHTQASYERVLTLRDPTARIRLKQFHLIHRFIMKKTLDRAPGEPIILQGDLNVDARVHDSARSLTPQGLFSTHSSKEYRAMMAVLSGDSAVVESLIRSPTQRPTSLASASSSPRLASAVPPSSTLGPSTETAVAGTKPSTAPLPFRDLVYDELGYHPVTFGDIEFNDHGAFQPKDLILTGLAEHASCQRLDYALWVDPLPMPPIPKGTTTISQPRYTVEPAKASVVPLHTHEFGTSAVFTQISDHYGVATTLHLVPVTDPPAVSSSSSSLSVPDQPTPQSI
ncbi:hypothetical protein H4R34_002888 [Dimargaris verticillata]|uniref:sphingomyelin phosphodiesterase n=1 Tax=Dimargaris verticillata TaxID=2761393 RepID=A0A9W8E9J7_9FUNG|nr:hypothetical protein H4R34_002888 [Dimargaris verticillata]